MEDDIGFYKYYSGEIFAVVAAVSCVVVGISMGIWVTNNLHY